MAERPATGEDPARARQRGLRPGVPQLVLAVERCDPPSGPHDLLGWRMELLLLPLGPAGGVPARRMAWSSVDLEFLGARRAGT